jgi:molybdopterin molybdotransferase
MMASGSLEIEDARRLILDAARPVSCEQLELVAALGRVLVEDASAAEAVPAFDSSAMDGFAVRAHDVAHAAPGSPSVLRVVGEARAGSPTSATVGDGQAISISTGAMVPTGADAVVRVEDTRPDGECVEVFAPCARDQDIRRAGEDAQAGQRVLRAGRRIGPAELGVLGSLGYETVACAREPRLSVLVSGDELLAPGEPMRPGAVRDSNSLTIGALARRAGAQVIRSDTMPDEVDATTRAIAAAVDGADVVVICGGVSVGAHDHVRPSLEALGARQVFWGIALKPGHPAWFGTLHSTLIFALPGNPVSAMVTFVLLVAPALRALLGVPAQDARYTAVMDVDYEKPAGRAHAVRCRLCAHDDGWHAIPTGAQGSHILTSMLDADALAIIPSDTVKIRAGQRVRIEPLRRWVGEFL